MAYTNPNLKKKKTGIMDERNPTFNQIQQRVGPNTQGLLASQAEAERKRNPPNPDVPRITANPDKSVTIEAGGQTYTQPREAYERMIGFGNAPHIMPEQQAIHRQLQDMYLKQQHAKLTAQINKDLELGIETPDEIKDRLLQAEAQRQGLFSPQVQQPIGQLPEQQLAQGQLLAEQPITSGQPQVTEKPNALGVASNLVFGNMLEKNPLTNEVYLDEKGQPIKTASNIILPISAASISIIPAIQTAATSARGARVASLFTNFFKLNSLKAILSLGGLKWLLTGKEGEANSILAESLGTMDDVIKDVEEGRTSYDSGMAEIDRQVAYINRAESKVKWINDNDVLEYLAGGFDTAVKIENAKRLDIPRKRILMQEAGGKAEQKRMTEAMNQARLNYGRQA